MQRVLIVAAVVLALVVGVLLWQRGGKPSEAARPAVAAAPVAPAPAPVAEPAKPAEPARPVESARPALAPKPVEQAGPAVAAKPVEQARPAVAAKPAAPAPAPVKVAAPAPAPARPAKAVAAEPAAAVAAAVAAPISAPVPADPPANLRTDLTGGVAGTLLDGKGAPIAGANVVAVSADGKDAFETITGDEGFYLMSAMKPGRYVLFPGLGTPVASRIGAPNVEVVHGQVRRYDLVEPRAGATVRVRPLRADGLPASAQVVLVRGRVTTPASLPALLAGEAIFIPEVGAGASVLRRVPAGVYTLVILQGEDVPPRVVREQVTIRGDGEQQVDVRVPGDLVAAWSPAAG